LAERGTGAAAGSAAAGKASDGAHRARIAGQALAFGAIRAVSALTVAILVLIIGFVVYRGLRYSNATRGPALPYLEGAPDGLALAVNPSSRLESVDFSALYGMFTDEYINWAKISGQDFDLVPAIADPATRDGLAAARMLFGEATDAKAAASMLGGLVKVMPVAAAALRAVETMPGAAALVPAGAAAQAEREGKVAVVPLRRLVLAVNDEAAALVGNRSVEDLDDAAIRKLLAGEVRSWSELGGPDLPVAFYAPPPGSPLAAAAAAAGYSIGSRAGGSGAAAPSTPSYLGAIRDTAGAVGLAFAADAQAEGLQTLTRKGRESGWNLTLRYLVEAPGLSGKVGGISTIIANTFMMLALTILLSGPVGIAAAAYLVEYAKQGTLVRIIRLGTETLAGIPSIIFGLFGFLFFVNILRLGFGLLSGCLTLTLMILPTIVRTSEEALKSVPKQLREGSLALGATKLQTILRVVVPAASPGILTGLILAIGRAVGETAALLFTMGSDYKLAKGLSSSARSLSAHVYLLFAEGISFDRAFSTATVLIFIVLAFNAAARLLVGRMGGDRR
jgi:phosphate transport system permease protein